MKEYQTISEISGPLVFAEVDEPIGYDEIVEIETPEGDTKRGQVLESTDGVVAIQVFEGTTGIDKNASVRFLGETLKMPVTEDLLGRVLDGSGQPIDGGPEIVPDERHDIVGAAALVGEAGPAHAPIAAPHCAIERDRLRTGR